MAAVHYHTGRFPPEERLDWPVLVPLIGPAVAAVARYDGVLSAIPDPGVLLAPLTTREAVLSSRIEGTEATIEEVLEFEAGQEPESPARRDDIHEVINYRAAVRRAEKMLKELPLCQRVILEAHSVLLAGVRGEGKSPGAYRRTPNWIGPPGCLLRGLLAVSRDDDWTGWCRFFLNAVPAQAEDNFTKAKGILDLYEDMKRRVADLTRSRYAIEALDWIFERPIFSSSDFVTTAGIPGPTARRFLKVLRGGKILRELSPGRGLTPPKSRAVVDHLGLREDADCFKEIGIGKMKHARYSPKAIERIKDALEAETIDEIWATHKARQGLRGESIFRK